MASQVILTVDYERWGNGTGDFKEIVYEPTEIMLDSCERVGAKLTIFAELGHYWAMLNSGLSEFDRDINLFESQLQDAILRGHDVQLHLHPQWIGAHYDGIWQLDFSKWACSELSFEEIFSLLKKGKFDLENLLKPIRNDYVCNVFRAGGWCATPSQSLVKALIGNDFIIDSSVAKGVVLKSNVSHVDYSNAYSNVRPWLINEDDINKSSSSGRLIEYPIFSSRKFLPLIIVDKNQKMLSDRVRSVPRTKGGGPIFISSKSSYCGRIISSIYPGRYYQNDFCTVTSKILVRNLKRILYYRLGDFPVVYISHTKNFVDNENFLDFLEQVSKMRNCVFGTYQSSHEAI